MAQLAFTSSYFTELGKADPLTRFGDLRLDHADALQTLQDALDATDAGGPAPAIISVDLNRIEALIGGYTIILSGSGLTPAAPDTATSGSLATGAFSTLTVTGPTAPGTAPAEVLRVTAAPNGSAYTITSGNQSFVIKGALPNTVLGLADLWRTLAPLGDQADLSPTARQALIDDLNAFAVTEVEVIDGGVTVFSVAITPTRLTVTFGALTLTLSGVMPPSFGDVLTIALTLQSLADFDDVFGALAELDGLTINSARVNGAFNLRLLAVTGPITDAQTYDNARATLNGGPIERLWTGGTGDDAFTAPPTERTGAFGFGGNDNLQGSSRADRMFGGEGDDTLNGRAGNDILYGDAGVDIIYGDDGNDLIYTGNGNDIGYGGTGRDTIGAGSGNDFVYGGDGEDRLMGGNDNDTVYGGLDNDLVRGDAGDDVLFGDAGNDTLSAGTGNDLGYGGEGDDRLVGFNGNDTLFGDAGNDIIWGGNGNDALYGGDGNDLMGGGGWSDVMYGGAGDDTLLGGTGNDSLYAGDGNDSLRGDDANDYMDGGAGADRLFGGAGNDTLLGGAGDDRIGGDDGNDLMHAGDGNDTVWGGAGNDTLAGDDGDDAAWGSDGDDFIYGGNGNDQLYGGDGDDQLYGGGGNDLMIGGAGADTFIFTGDFGSDRIRDFSITDGDTLTLSNAFWGGGSLTAGQVLSTYATVTASGVVLSFGAGNTILLEGLTTTAGLGTAIDFSL